MKIFLRSVVFCAVAVLTWTLTGGLRAQAPAPGVAMPLPDPEVTDTTLDNGGLSQARPGFNPQIAAPAETGGIHMQGFEAFALDGQAIIQSGVSISLKGPAQKFVWHVRILDSTATKVLDQKLYDDQVFQTNLDGTHLSNFGDILPLPPGKSRVQLRLYALPINVNMTSLLSEKKARPYVVLQDYTDLVNN